jgi:fluoride exporter
VIPRLAAVAVGGSVGACLRWLLGQEFPETSGFPWTTFTINVLGSLLLAVALRRTRHPLLTAAVGPGLLGGFTTLSAYSGQARALFAHGHEGLALGYLLTTLVVCVAAVEIVRLWPRPAGASVLDQPVDAA